tara:strand:+ start:7255 stop:7488 length:234 start_codon:yes stop_codon:yes gene_type:complete
MEKKLLLELLESIKKSNARLDQLEELFQEIREMVSIPAEEDKTMPEDEDMVVPITDEIYKMICREIGSKTLFFMAIA